MHFSKTVNLFNLVLKMSDNKVNATNDCFIGHLTSCWGTSVTKDHTMLLSLQCDDLVSSNQNNYIMSTVYRVTQYIQHWVWFN